MSSRKTNEHKPTTSSFRNAAIAVFETHDRVEAAVHRLRDDGIDMEAISIVGKDLRIEEHVVGYHTASERTLLRADSGNYWGGFCGLLFGSAFFRVPGVGPLLIAGPLVTAIIGTSDNSPSLAVLSALGGALASIGIPKNSVVQYESEVENGRFLLVLHGTPVQVSQAKAVLDRTSA